MASPRPSAVTRLIEKIDTSVNCVMMNSVRNVPNTDTAPTASGSEAATSPPKTSTNNTSVMGTAIDSAVARSPWIVSEICWNTGAWPPADTVIGPCLPVTASTISLAEVPIEFSVPVILATMMALVPSTDRSGGTLPSDQ